MTQYIKHENQSILWKTIQKIELFHTLFYPHEQEIWFKEIIGQFYNKYKHQTLSMNDLEKINRETIEHMIMTLKSIHPNSSIHVESPKKNISFQEPLVMHSKTMSLDFRPQYSSNLEKKSVGFNYTDEYATRQQDYEKLLTRETPKDINFKEDLPNDVIKNMDELLEQQKKLRELDFGGFPPPPPPPNMLSSSSKKRLIIDKDDSENISLNFVELSSPELDSLAEQQKQLRELDFGGFPTVLSEINNLGTLQEGDRRFPAEEIYTLLQNIQQENSELKQSMSELKECIQQMYQNTFNLRSPEENVS